MPGDSLFQFLIEMLRPELWSGVLRGEAMCFLFGVWWVVRMACSTQTVEYIGKVDVGGQRVSHVTVSWERVCFLPNGNYP